MSDLRIRMLQRRLDSNPGDLEAAAQLGIELRRALDIINIIGQLDTSIQAAIAARYCEVDTAVKEAVDRLTDEISAYDVAQHISASDVADYVEARDVAEYVADQISASDVAYEISASDVAEYIDKDDLVQDVAHRINAEEVAQYIDMDDLAERVKDLM